MIVLLMKYSRSVIKEQLFGYVRMVAQLCKNNCSVIEKTVFPKLKNGQSVLEEQSFQYVRTVILLLENSPSAFEDWLFCY